MVGCNGPAEGRVGDTSPDKDTALNGDMLAALSKHKRLRCFKTRHFQASTRNKEPAAKFSALLVHWVPNCSNMTVRITLFLYFFLAEILQRLDAWLL